MSTGAELVRAYVEQEEDYFLRAVTPTRAIEEPAPAAPPRASVMLPPPRDPALTEGRELARVTRERDLLLRLLAAEVGPARAAELAAEEGCSDLEEGRLVRALAAVEWMSARVDQADARVDAERDRLAGAAAELGRVLGVVDAAAGALERGYRLRALSLLRELVEAAG